MTELMEAYGCQKFNITIYNHVYWHLSPVLRFDGNFSSEIKTRIHVSPSLVLIISSARQCSMRG